MQTNASRRHCKAKSEKRFAAQVWTDFISIADSGFWTAGSTIAVISQAGTCACFGIGLDDMNRLKQATIFSQETTKYTSMYCFMATPNIWPRRWSITLIRTLPPSLKSIEGILRGKRQHQKNYMNAHVKRF